MAMPQPARDANGLGSGFIVNKAGIILTNNHVSRGRQVWVQLGDQRRFERGWSQ